MRGVVRLGQVLEVQAGVDLGRGDVGVAQQLLDRPQVAARLQQVAGKRMAQHVRVHRRREPRQQAAAFQPLPDGLGREPRAVAAGEKRGLLAISVLLAQGQPTLQRLQRLAPDRHRAALAALAQHMGLARPADRSSRGQHRSPWRPAPPVRPRAGRSRTAVPPWPHPAPPARGRPRRSHKPPVAPRRRRSGPWAAAWAPWARARPAPDCCPPGPAGPATRRSRASPTG